MLTKTYKTIQLLVHILSILQILLSLSLFITQLKFEKYIKIEPYLKIPYFEIKNIYKLAELSGLIMALFAICCIYTKKKFYMKIYLILNFIANILFGCFILYLKFKYLNFFKIGIAGVFLDFSEQTRICIYYGCSNSSDNRIFMVLLDDARSLRNLFLILGGMLTLMMGFTFLLVRIALKVPSRCQSPQPKICLNERVGFETVSLRNKRVIENKVKNDFNEIITNES